MMICFSPLLYVQDAVAIGGKHEAAEQALSGARHHQRKIAFTCVAFSQQRIPGRTELNENKQQGGAALTADELRERLVEEHAEQPQALLCAVDQRGHVYVLDLLANK